MPDINQQDKESDFCVGEEVVTPGGIGILYHIEGDQAVVEMDHRYLVQYPLNEIKKI